MRACADIPIFVGEAAARIHDAAGFFTGKASSLTPTRALRHRESFDVGPFLITLYLNDHSAFDTYSILVEAGGRRLFYTADLRAHGRKPGCFSELLRRPPKGVDVLLMEGTHVGRRDDTHVGTAEDPRRTHVVMTEDPRRTHVGNAHRPRGLTEQEVEAAAVKVIREARGPVLEAGRWA